MKKFLEELGGKAKRLLENGEATKDRSVNFKLIVFALLLTAAVCVGYFLINIVLAL